MPVIPALTTYVDGNTLPASSLNNDFGTLRTYANAYLLFKDVAGTVSVGHTWTATQTLTPGSGYALDITTGGMRIQAGGLEVTGNALVTGEIRSIDSSVNTRLRSVNASSVGQVGTFSNHDLWFVTNSTQRIALTSAGHLVPISSGSYDLGLTGARWKDGWFGGNLTVSGNITFSGSLTGGTFGATTFSGLITGNSGLTISSGTTALQATNVTGVLTSSGSAALGSSSDLATGATDGFLYIPRMNGTPTGVPTLQGNRVAMCFDYSANLLWIYDNVVATGWRSVALT